MKLRTCVTPEGVFRYGVHAPSYRVVNFREVDHIEPLGRSASGQPIDNLGNFPPDDLDVAQTGTVFEIANALPFRGTTYINKSWADRAAADNSLIGLPGQPPLSFQQVLAGIPGLDDEQKERFFESLPQPLLLALAQHSTDPHDLERLAGLCCRLVSDPLTGLPVGLEFNGEEQGQRQPAISNHELFEVLVNNPRLPNLLKEAMVLRPGIQGPSEIVGEWRQGGSHAYEYLRRNSYIPWGHFAANMADDAVRYRIEDLTAADMEGLRHLYYQRIYARLAEELGVAIPASRRRLSVDELEKLRLDIVDALAAQSKRELRFDCALWGWNYGFAATPGGYRLHASHQQIHNQYALVPATAPAAGSEIPALTAFAAGDMVAEMVEAYQRENGRSFFDDYLRAIRANTRFDARQDLERSLVVFEDQQVLLFVPKAQTSQWELNLMPLQPVGNILEADSTTRGALDLGIRMALQALTGLGAGMVTVVEYSKRFRDRSDQRLLYSFLPKLPYSMGGMSEAQLRFINGHYPEDFAAACRARLEAAG